MRLLLDTCFLSELVKPAPDTLVVSFARTASAADMHVSVLSLGEIANGLVRMNAGRRRDEIARWLTGLELHYQGRLLPVDAEIAKAWGGLSARARMDGNATPVVDSLLAATALVHGLVVVTRNVRHFQCLGVEVINPWRS